jgi:hypothetical protein
MGGHDHRHLLAEVGRVADLSTRRCELLCYWRAQGVVGESQSDQVALARAVAAARAAPTRAGPMRFQSDRYASVDAQPVMEDDTKVTCLRIVAGVMQANGATAYGVSQLKTTRDQLTALRAFVYANGGGAA